MQQPAEFNPGFLIARALPMSDTLKNVAQVREGVWEFNWADKLFRIYVLNGVVFEMKGPQQEESTTAQLMQKLLQNVQGAMLVEDGVRFLK